MPPAKDAAKIQHSLQPVTSHMHAHLTNQNTKIRKSTLIIPYPQSAHHQCWPRYQWLEPQQILGKSYHCFCSLFAHIIVWAAPLLVAFCCHLISWTRRPPLKHLTQFNVLVPFGKQLTPSATIFLLLISFMKCFELLLAPELYAWALTFWSMVILKFVVTSSNEDCNC